MRRMRPGPGQESVWDYPRPPRLEVSNRLARLTHAGVVVADTDDLVRILETSHPPTYYLPRTAFRVPLRSASRITFCEWKGSANYVDIEVTPTLTLREIGWLYEHPDPRYPQLLDRLAVYPSRIDEITLDGEVITPQPGEFYGGWITADVVGPFKGAPGTWGW